MADYEQGNPPLLAFLTEADKEKIFSAALRVLEQTGMALMHDGARSRLTDAGCRADNDGRVRIPPHLAEDAVKRAPSSVKIYDRQGSPAMDLGGRRAYFGTGSDLMWSVSSDTLERRRTCLEDIRTAARVCDALPNIDFIMSFAHPHELEPAVVYIESFRAMLENSTKPIVNTADSRRDLKAMWQMSVTLRSGEQALREKPYWVQYGEPISPLKHPFNAVDKLIFCAETGSPVIYSPAPIAGSTAPMTIAGHVVQGLAECLFGLVIHQLISPGAPFLMGMGPAVLDMATGQCSYNAPEYLLAYMSMVEISLHLDLPNWGYAGTSDAQIPDMQASFEAGLETFMAAAAGSNLNHDVGYLDFGLTGSLEMIVIMNEIIDQVKRLGAGIPVNEDTLAEEVIAAGARQGEFLTHSHTLKHVRRVQWQPRLFCRQEHESWSADGRTDLLTRARRQLAEILENHQPQPLDSSLSRSIAEIAAAHGAAPGKGLRPARRKDP